MFIINLKISVDKWTILKNEGIKPIKNYQFFNIFNKYFQMYFFKNKKIAEKDRISVMKKILLIIIGIFVLSGFAFHPLSTKFLTDGVKSSGVINNLHVTFIDAREAKFKKEKSFELNYIFPTIYSCGDSSFDMPLNIVFEKMFLKRFPNNPNGFKTEIKISKFYYTWSPKQLAIFPIIGIFVIGADVEYHGYLKIDVVILDKNNKFIFTKQYSVDLKDMKSPFVNTIYKDGFGLMLKAFVRVTDEFETDISRIKFD